MSYPAKYDFDARQGSTVSRTFTWKVDGTAQNLTGWSARMQVRPAAGSDILYVSLTSGSGITLGGAAGTVTVTVSATTMAAVPPGKHEYDLELVNGGGEVTPFLAGAFKVSAEVTR